MTSIRMHLWCMNFVHENFRKRSAHYRSGRILRVAGPLRCRRRCYSNYCCWLYPEHSMLSLGSWRTRGTSARRFRRLRRIVQLGPWPIRRSCSTTRLGWHSTTLLQRSTPSSISYTRASPILGFDRSNLHCLDLPWTSSSHNSRPGCHST